MTEQSPEPIPEWAYRRREQLRRPGEFVGDAFARYIAQHEQAPVDPLDQAIGDAFDALPGLWNRATFVESVGKTLRKRGLELGRADDEQS